MVVNGSAGATLLALADQTAAVPVGFNGDDAVVIWKGGVDPNAPSNGTGTMVDSFGQVGTDPGTDWGTAPNGSLDNSLRRKATILNGDTNATDAFDPLTGYDSAGTTDDFSNVGMHTIVTATTSAVALSPDPLTGLANDAQDTVVAEFTVAAANGDVTISAFTLDPTGSSATVATDIAAQGVAIYLDNGDDTFDAGLDTVIGTASDFSGGSPLVFNSFASGNVVTSGATARYYIVYDLAGQASDAETFNLVVGLTILARVAGDGVAITGRQLTITVSGGGGGGGGASGGCAAGASGSLSLQLAMFAIFTIVAVRRRRGLID
ncbi:MAG: hypothetical protein AB7K09_13935 [Planctomycetota bacterium]